MRAPLNRSVVVLGTGSYLPGRRISNVALRDLVSNYDEAHSGDFSTWVDRVTHIHERRYIADGETTATMGAEAARRALDMAGVKPTELDLIIHASFTPTSAVPGDHSLMAAAIGAKSTASFQLMGACAGSVFGMGLAYGMLASRTMRRILVVGAETITPTLDFSDPLTAILFGDGAGAVVLGAVTDSEGGMLPPFSGFDSNPENITLENLHQLPAPRTAGGREVTIRKSFLKMLGGPSVLRNAVNAMALCVRRVLGHGEEEEAALAEDLAHARLIPHQANGRIVDGLAKKLGMDETRVTKTLYKTGNISAASNLIGLDYAVRHGSMRVDREEGTERILEVHEVRNPIRRGDLVVLPTIGAGYVFGAAAFVHTI
ncbi:MAG: 3-oxoacyl-ACP synthase III family protein [Planctomycetaceae bacterium]